MIPNDEQLQEAVKRTKDVLSHLTATVYCQTCGEVFLPTMPYDQFVEMHSDSEELKDIWFLKASVHWLRNMEHQIIADIPDQPQFLSPQFAEEWLTLKDKFAVEEAVAIQEEGLRAQMEVSKI